MDIKLIKDSESIRNGDIVTTSLPTGKTSVLRVPTVKFTNIASIENLYNNRWDDINYYMGGGSTDGGDVGNIVDGGTYTGS